MAAARAPTRNLTDTSRAMETDAPAGCFSRAKIHLPGAMMGEFARNARHGEIAGPSQRGFRREAWEQRMNDPALDDDDRRVLVAGLFLDELLSFLRGQIQLSGIDMRPQAVVRLPIGLVPHTPDNVHHK